MGYIPPLENRIVVTQENFLATLGNGVDSTKEYFLDGKINTGATVIEVPATGINIAGYNFDTSGLYSLEDNYTMFVSEVGGSGNFIGKDYEISVVGVNSKVYDLVDVSGFNAFEFARINYINCTSLGEIDGYRQGLESGTGRYGGSPSLTLTGAWMGGYVLTTINGFSMSDVTTEPIFKAGLGFVMQGRFRTNMNVNLGALQPFVDFAPVNFPNPSTLQLNQMQVARGGVVDPSDTNITPNISYSDVSCQWNQNKGIRNTFVGAKSVITTEIETVIATVGVPVPILGTQVASDLQHFDSPANGQLRLIGNNPVEFTVSWDFILEGRANDDYRIDLCIDRGGVKEIAHSQIRVINNLQGGRDVAYFTGSTHEELFKDDFTYWEVTNLTDTRNCTLELDSDWIIDHR